MLTNAHGSIKFIALSVWFSFCRFSAIEHYTVINLNTFNISYFNKNRDETIST